MVLSSTFGWKLHPLKTVYILLYCDTNATPGYECKSVTAESFLISARCRSFQVKPDKNYMRLAEGEQLQL